MPDVEPVDSELLNGNDNEDKGIGFEGMRLATMSAIRDQETAIARERRAGHSELAKLTAESLASMNQVVDNLEEALCLVAEDVADLYEVRGPQNRDIALRAATPDEGTELLQAKVIPVSEVCDQIDLWREAIGEEVASVINKHKAGTFRTEKQ